MVQYPCYLCTSLWQIGATCLTTQERVIKPEKQRPEERASVQEQKPLLAVSHTIHVTHKSKNNTD